MSLSTWEKIDEIFALVADLAGDERDARLRALCGDDEALRGEILALLAADEKAGSFCEVPALLPNSLSHAFRTAQKDALICELAGEKVGDYRILSKLGAGGMGAVYLAERDDGAFRKKVAVKFIRSGLDTDFNLRRFRHERQVLATFEHPHIARLLDGGTAPNGLPFIVMEYVEGRTLFEYCDARGLDLHERLALFRQICAAVAHAHAKQIIHRDLKPGNILVTEEGQAKLLDFGIAKILDPDFPGEPVARTETLWRQMTPEYASPEQIKGEEITPAADIYSLGVILYELATGERPYKFPSRAPHEIARVVCEEPARPPRFRFRLPQADDLSLIVLKALNKKPHERFASVTALDAAVERLMQGLSLLTEDTRLAPSERAAPKSGGAAVSLAVAPFRILPTRGGADDAQEDFFGVGLSDAVTTKLSGVRQLAVHPTSSVLRASADGKDALALGRQLGADYVLEGHIQRAGERIRVSVQLLETRDFSVLWAELFDEAGSDVFRLQDSISERVAASLVPQLATDEQEILRRHGTENAAAYEAYLRGRVFFHDYTFGGISAAEECFATAIAHDPNFALAHCALADFYNLQTVFGLTTNHEGFARAKQAALKAVELDPNLGEAYAALAFSTWAFDWDFDEAERLFAKSFALNPNYPRAREWYAFLLSVGERHEEALASMRRAERLEPDSAAVASMFSLVLYNARRYEESLAKARRALELDPHYYIALQSLGWICPRIGRFEEAIDGCRRAVAVCDEQPLNKFSLALALIDAGETSEAREIAAELEARREKSVVPAYYLAVIYACLKEDEKSFAWFDTAIEERGYYTLRMRVEPRLDRLRGDARFDALLARLRSLRDASTSDVAATAPTAKIRVGRATSVRLSALAALLAVLGGASYFIFHSFRAAPRQSLPEQTENTRAAQAETVPPTPPTADSVAETLYREGKQQMEIRTPDSIEKAIEFFNEAVRRDPKFALGYSGLANAHILSVRYGNAPRETAYRKAEEYAVKALALDPDLPEARTSLGMAVYRNTGNFEFAERHFLRAIEINPAFPTAHHWYSVMLSENGRDDEALREIVIAAELEPRSSAILHSVGAIYMKKQKFAEAIPFFDRAIENEKNFVQSYIMKAVALQVTGDYAGALETYRTGRIYGGGGETDPFWLIVQAQAAAAAGRREEALGHLDRLFKTPEFRKDPGLIPFDVALVYSLLGDNDRAFAALETLKFKDREKIHSVGTDPRAGALQADPRFAPLVEKWKAQTPVKKTDN